MIGDSVEAAGAKPVDVEAEEDIAAVTETAKARAAAWSGSSNSVTVRLRAETFEQLKELMSKYNRNKTEVLNKAVALLYDTLVVQAKDL